MTSLLFDSSCSQLFLLFLYDCNSFWFKIGLNNCLNPSSVTKLFRDYIVQAKFTELDVVSRSFGIAFTVIHRGFYIIGMVMDYMDWTFFASCHLLCGKKTLFRKLIINLSAEFLYTGASKLFCQCQVSFLVCLMPTIQILNNAFPFLQDCLFIDGR